MPLFEYTCRHCGHRFELLVMGGRTPACPNCTSSDLDKLYSTFGTRASRPESGAALPRFT